MLNKVIGVIKIIWLFFWASLILLVLFLPIYLSALMSRTGNFPFTLSKIWAYVMLFIAGVRVSITGRERIRAGQSYVIISNHQSQYDILALVTALRIQFRWVIKKEILKIPLFGYALYKSRNIFIDRSNPEMARASIARGLNRLKPGVSVMVFAEGTRSADGRLQELKKGGFVIAREKGFPILPVTVNGSRNILPKGSLVFSPGRIRVVVGEPVASTGPEGEVPMDTLMSETRRRIQENLES
jgi:1-acyl-sn-glycerol-3-phosphate acyltransferase